MNLDLLPGYKTYAGILGLFGFAVYLILAGQQEVGIGLVFYVIKSWGSKEQAKRIEQISKDIIMNGGPK